MGGAVSRSPGVAQAVAVRRVQGERGCAWVGVCVVSPARGVRWCSEKRGEAREGGREGKGRAGEGKEEGKDGCPESFGATRAAAVSRCWAVGFVAWVWFWGGRVRGWRRVWVWVWVWGRWVRVRAPGDWGGGCCCCCCCCARCAWDAAAAVSIPCGGGCAGGVRVAGGRVWCGGAGAGGAPAV